MSVVHNCSANQVGDIFIMTSLRIADIELCCLFVCLSALLSVCLYLSLCVVLYRHNCRGYWTDHYNLAQISTFCLLFAVVPLRYLDPDGRAQWVLLSLGYFITMTRSFKFISTSRYKPIPNQ